MAGGQHLPVTGPFIPPKVKGRGFSIFLGAIFWSFMGYRIYKDGGHHFLHKHDWEHPRVIEHLEKVDKKYGTRYALDNMHHH
ncbi:hypothetical protein HDV06_003433 [Boothiomyces sp. JEL0866]|nr:hypothetical protein HDV06_003385 [Boothiomyces sp. JEL0866]KAJ3325663.1 hypothetical protein HDV06_003433 [Boothiomyces sp. JEL0866]